MLPVLIINILSGIYILIKEFISKSQLISMRLHIEMKNIRQDDIELDVDSQQTIENLITLISV